MASEYCKVLILSQLEYLSTRINDKKSDGLLFRKILDGTRSLSEVLNREIKVCILYSYTDLMPINLVKFNNETETEE